MRNTMNMSYIINYRDNAPQSLSASIDGRPYNLSAGHNNFRLVVAELSKPYPDIQRIKALCDVQRAVCEYSGQTVSVKNGEVLYGGEAVHGVIVDRILAFMREGLPYKPLLRFLENLMKNPSARSRQELYGFLEALNNKENGAPSITLTSDGCFLAYKGVRDDYYSLTSGSVRLVKGKVRDGYILNKVGEKIEMERGKVDDNCNRTCSFGLHCGSYGYAQGFAGATGRLVIVKVNPKDVVSIPTDCNAQKCRTCAYEVVSEAVNHCPLNVPYTDDYDDLDDYDFGSDTETLWQEQPRDAQGRFCSRD